MKTPPAFVGRGSLQRIGGDAMEKTTSTAESIVYTILSFLGFTRLGPPGIPEQRIPQMANVILRSYIKNGRQVIDVQRVVEVKANPLPYHREQGWKKNVGVYQGYFRCRLGAFKGEIKESCNGDFTFYIFNPPSELLAGSHKACFSPIGSGCFHIHFRIKSNNLDSGIMAVERLLTQSLSRR